MSGTKITQRNQGEVSEEGLQNWRGDQVSIAPGGQSIYQASTIQLAQNGSRKVVGDRVFRYARAGAELEAGEIAGKPATIAGEITVTAGSDALVGGKLLNIYFATALTKDELAEGYIHVQSGVAKNKGYMYRIKSNPTSVAATTSNALVLYDEVSQAITSTDKVTIIRNLYAAPVVCDTAKQPVGVAPIYVTSNDYFWLQTWGPTSVGVEATGALTEGAEVRVGTGGAAQTGTVGVNPSIGVAMQVGTNSTQALVFLTIAP